MLIWRSNRTSFMLRALLCIIGSVLEHRFVEEKTFKSFHPAQAQGYIQPAHKFTNTEKLQSRLWLGNNNFTYCLKCDFQNSTASLPSIAAAARLQCKKTEEPACLQKEYEKSKTINRRAPIDPTNNTTSSNVTCVATHYVWPPTSDMTRHNTTKLIKVCWWFPLKLSMNTQRRQQQQQMHT